MGKSDKHDELEIEFVEEWVFISNSKFHFSGYYAKSENGKYTLAWKEDLNVINNAKEIEDDETNYNDEQLTEAEELLYAKYLEQKFTEGFILLEDQKIVLKMYLPRPSNGKVSNNGSFILNSGIDRSNELKGRFVAYNKTGQELVNHRFTANLGINSLSNDGRYAVCQTWYSKTKDGHTVTCFDLINGKLIWQKTLETRVADAIEFSLNTDNLIFINEGVGNFRYSMTGELLDKKQWYEARIKHGTGFELIEIANEKLENISENNSKVLDEVLDLYLMAVKRIDSNYFLAKVHRKIGEVYELMGKIDKTITHFEQAQKYNPKIGVKKKLQKMKSEVE